MSGSVPDGISCESIGAGSELGLLPLPLAGEGWGGGELHIEMLVRAPPYPSPGKRGRGGTECAAC
jgi:hypothetical protein